MGMLKGVICRGDSKNEGNSSKGGMQVGKGLSHTRHSWRVLSWYGNTLLLAAMIFGFVGPCIKSVHISWHCVLFHCFYQWATLQLWFVIRPSTSAFGSIWCPSGKQVFSNANSLHSLDVLTQFFRWILPCVIPNGTDCKCIHVSKIGVNLDSYSKGEFGLGQHELNLKYAEILEMADRHVVYKQVCIICFHFWYLEKVMTTCLISVILLLPMANVICTLSFCHLVPLLSLTFLQKSFKCAFVVSLAPFTPCELCDLDTWMNWHKPISTLLVQCLKELADATGVSVTFMAKPDAAQPGSSCHIHLSLWKDGHNIFAGNHSLGSTKCRSESDDFWSHPSQFLSIHKSNLMQWTSGPYWKLWWRCLLHSCSLQEGQWYWVCCLLGVLSLLRQWVQWWDVDSLESDMAGDLYY